MKRLLLLLLFVSLPRAALGQNWVVQNGSNVLTASTPLPAMAVRQRGTGYAFCVQSATSGLNVWCIDKNGVSTSTVASIFGVNAIATTSTDGLIISNTTLATGGVTVQMSPRSKWCGAAWNSTSGLSETDCFFLETLPATVAGTTTATFKLGYIGNGAAATYPLTVTNAGVVTALSSFISSNGGMGACAGCAMSFTGRTTWSSPADGLFNVNNNAGTVGAQINVGTAAPTVTTCGTGAVTAKSTNAGGEFSTTGTATCTLTFGLPNWTNAPFCVFTEETTAGPVRISARSVSAVTITGFTSGDTFTYVCVGGT